MSPPTEPVRYGQVWVSRDEVMGPMNYLVTLGTADRSSIASVTFRARSSAAFQEDIRGCRRRSPATSCQP